MSTWDQRLALSKSLIKVFCFLFDYVILRKLYGNRKDEIKLKLTLEVKDTAGFQAD
jgi:hypothetical protein